MRLSKNVDGAWFSFASMNLTVAVENLSFGVGSSVADALAVGSLTQSPDGSAGALSGGFTLAQIVRVVVVDAFGLLLFVMDGTILVQLSVDRNLKILR